MSTSADIEYVTSALDFEPECDVTTMQPGGSRLKCTNPAAWIGVPPCGHEDYFCREHRNDPRLFSCLTCKRRDMNLNTYRWIPI